MRTAWWVQQPAGSGNSGFAVYCPSTGAARITQCSLKTIQRPPNSTTVMTLQTICCQQLHAVHVTLLLQVPCSPKITTCPNAPIPTTGPNGFLAYALTGGHITFDSPDMPVQQTAWSKLALYRQKEYCDNNDSIAGLKAATHLCSYLCKTGSYTGEPINWCLLWPAQGSESKQYNYCLEGSGRDTKFPMTNPLYPPDVTY